MKQKYPSRLIFSFKAALLFTLLLSFTNTDAPLIVYDELFNQSDLVTLGLDFAEGTETISVFEPTESTDKYSNGVVMIGFKDSLYCMWQSSAKDEDAADTWVAYSRSLDGKTWSEPMVISETIDNGYCSSGGWWTTGDTLVAYINTWPASVSPRGGYVRYSISTDGLSWSEPKAVLMDNGDTLKGIFEQDPHALPDGRIIGAAHLQPGLKASPLYTDDPYGISGWIKGDFTNLSSGDVSRELEPSWYLRGDGAAVMTFRDQNGTYKRLASVSLDRGESWTTAVLTNMPDSRSKQSAGNLGDSTAFLVGNPVTNKTRIPLAITLSQDGFFFNTAYLLRAGGDSLQALRFDGQYKRAGYHYPKSMVWKDTLYVSYSSNKEDVEFTRVPLISLKLDTITIDTTPDVSFIRNKLANADFTVKIDRNRRITILQEGSKETGTASVYNINGALINQQKIYNGYLSIEMANQPAGIYLISVQTPTTISTKKVYLN